MRKRTLLLLLALIVLAGGGYALFRMTRPVLSDQKQITNAIIGAAHALEQHRVQSFMRIVADDYNDGTYSRQDLENQVRGAVLGADQIRVVTYLHSGSPVVEGTTARAVLDAEITVSQIRPGSSPGEPTQGRYTVQTTWRKAPHGWQITSATGWESAPAQLGGE